MFRTVVDKGKDSFNGCSDDKINDYDKDGSLFSSCYMAKIGEKIKLNERI